MLVLVKLTNVPIEIGLVVGVLVNAAVGFGLAAIFETAEVSIQPCVDFTITVQSPANVLLDVRVVLAAPWLTLVF